MTYNEAIVNQAYCSLVKEFSRQQDFIFEHAEDNEDLLRRLVYIVVLLFRESSTEENYVLAFIKIIKEVLPTINVSREKLFNTLVYFKAAIEQSKRESGSYADNSSVMDNGKRGYIYVFINLSMNMLLSGNLLVKIGYTTRHPKIRARELSKPSGVPLPFELVYREFFDDCISAEEAIHAKLEKLGYRVSKNREFFDVPVFEVIEMIQDYKAGIAG